MDLPATIPHRSFIRREGDGLISTRFPHQQKPLPVAMGKAAAKRDARAAWALKQRQQLQEGLLPRTMALAAHGCHQSL
uniref:DUF429 domain-containing protein n=1 Tax=Allorhizobium terrae TaxID=1848972 RepID=UPI0038B231C9